MISRFASHTRWIWLLCLVLLAVRMGGAHLHLCFDGMEPPLAVHAGDIVEHGDEHASQHHDENANKQHADVDLNLVDNGIAKTIKQIAAMPILLAALIVLCLQGLVRTLPAPAYSTPLFQFIP